MGEIFTPPCAQGKKVDNIKHMRQSEYKESYCDELVALRSAGWTITECSAKWGVSRETYYNWLERYEAFKEAHLLAQEKYKAWFYQTMRDNIVDVSTKERSTRINRDVLNLLAFSQLGISSKSTDSKVMGLPAEYKTATYERKLEILDSMLQDNLLSTAQYESLVHTATKVFIALDSKDAEERLLRLEELEKKTR